MTKKDRLSNLSPLSRLLLESDQLRKKGENAKSMDALMHAYKLLSGLDESEIADGSREKYAKSILDRTYRIISVTDNDKEDTVNARACGLIEVIDYNYSLLTHGLYKINKHRKLYSMSTILCFVLAFFLFIRL